MSNLSSNSGGDRLKITLWFLEIVAFIWSDLSTDYRNIRVCLIYMMFLTPTKKANILTFSSNIQISSPIKILDVNWHFSNQSSLFKILIVTNDLQLSTANGRGHNSRACCSFHSLICHRIFVAKDSSELSWISNLSLELLFALSF